MLLLLSIVMKQLHLFKFYKLQLFAVTREYLVNLSILMTFLSIEVERFDKKNSKLNLVNKDKCYPNPMLACIGKKKDSGIIRLVDFSPDPDMSL